MKQLATKGVRRRYNAWKKKYNRHEKRLRALSKEYQLAKKRQAIYAQRLDTLTRSYIFA